MAHFELAIDLTLQEEGGYTITPGDSGGETYAGISRNNFPDWIGWSHIDEQKQDEPIPRNKMLPALDVDVRNFYKINFWDKIKADDIQDQGVAAYFFDWSVNAGSNAAKRIQRLLDIPDDGIFGNQSVTALNEAGDILPMLHNIRCAFYKEIAVGERARFLNGWLARANGLYEKLK